MDLRLGVAGVMADPAVTPGASRSADLDAVASHSANTAFNPVTVLRFTRSSNADLRYRL